MCLFSCLLAQTWCCFLTILAPIWARAEIVFFHVSFSRRIHWCEWEPAKTLRLKKCVNSKNANDPKTWPHKHSANIDNTLSEMASEISIWGIETWIRLETSIRMHWPCSHTPKTSFLTLKILTIGRSPKSRNLGGRQHEAKPLNLHMTIMHSVWHASFKFASIHSLRPEAQTVNPLKHEVQ